MTDKRLKSFLEDRLKRLESIRNEREFTTAELGDIACCKQTLAFIDSLQEEPVSKDFEMALAEMIDKAQKCVVEPLVIAAQWKDELIKLAKSEEPVSEKKCMFTNDSYTDEDRKVLCKDCDERCEYNKKEKPVSKDLELTWEDIKTIDKLLNQCVDYSNQYQEVLKRFKEMKK